jgi:hypothetical protein
MLWPKLKASKPQESAFYFKCYKGRIKKMEKTFAGGKYSFIIDEKRKVMECLGEGLFTLEIAKGYNDDFCKTAQKCAKKEYTLIVDVRNLKPVGMDQINSTMKDCIANYLSSEYQFKNVFLLKLNSVMTQSEANKVPNIQGITWVKDKEEAYSLL